MVCLGCHGPDQLVEVVVGGSEDGAVVVGSDGEYHSLAVGVEKLQLAQRRGDLGADDNLVDGIGEGQPLAAQIEELNWFDSVQETQVLAGQREFREDLSEAGIPHESHEVPGGHVFRPDMFRIDLDGIIARLRPASSGAAAGESTDTL
jgi:S-formylglutathione hydrolase FrmB